MTGWTKVASMMIVQASTIGLQYSFGILFVVLLDAFGKSRAETAWVGALSTGICEAAAVLAGVTVAQTSARFCVTIGGLITFTGLMLSSIATELWHLYLSFGVLVGLGHALMFPVGTIVLNTWFDKRRGLANGVGTTGVGLGTLIFGPLTEFLLQEYGWRSTFRVLSLSAPLAIAAALNYRTPAEVAEGCTCSWLIRPCSQAQPAKTVTNDSITPETVSAPSGANTATGGSSDTDEQKSTCARLMRSARMRRYLPGLFIFGWGFWVPVIHTPRFVLDCGQPAAAVATVVSAIGIGSLCGRIPMSWLADRYGRYEVYRLVVVAYGLATILLCFASSATPASVWTCYGVACGACCGSLMALTGPVAAEMVAGFDARVVAIASTVGFTFLGTGVALGPPLAGWMFDRSGDYSYSFAFAGGSLLLGALTLGLPLRCFGDTLSKAPPKDVAERSKLDGSKNSSEQGPDMEAANLTEDEANIVSL